MYKVLVKDETGHIAPLIFDKGDLTIGRTDNNDIVLPKGNVSKHHARIIVKDDNFIVVDLKSTNGTFMNGRKITAPKVLRTGDQLEIGDFIITIEPAMDQFPVQEWSTGEPSYQPEGAVTGMMPAAPTFFPAQNQQGFPAAPEAAPLIYGDNAAILDQGIIYPNPTWPIHSSPSSPSSPFYPSSPSSPSSSSPPPSVMEQEQSTGMGLGMEPVMPSSPRLSDLSDQPSPSLDKLTKLQLDQSNDELMPDRANPVTDFTTAICIIHQFASEEYGKLDGTGELSEKTKKKIEKTINRAVDDLTGSGAFHPGLDPALLAKSALAEAIGIGPIEDMLNDSTVQAIQIIGADNIMVDLGNGFEPAAYRFSHNQRLSTSLARLVSANGSRLDADHPLADLRTRDGIRIQALIPPVTPSDPVVLIRKPHLSAFTLAELASLEMMPLEVAHFIEKCIENRFNILVAGHSRSGRTTLLNAMANSLPSNEQIISIEWVRELNLRHKNLIPLLQSDPSNNESKKSSTGQDALLRLALGLKPDRLLIGDLNPKAVMSLIQALSCGFEGVMTCGQGLSPIDVFNRLHLQYNLSAPHINGREAGGLFCTSIDLIIICGVPGDHGPKVTQVARPLGMDGENVLFQEIYKLETEPRAIPQLILPVSSQVGDDVDVTQEEAGNTTI